MDFWRSGRWGARFCSDSTELPFQVVGGEFEGGGAAMRTVAGALREVALFEQRVDFIRAEGIAGFDGGFAGHHVEGGMDERFVGLTAAGLDKPIKEIGDERPDVHSMQESGETLYGEGAWAEDGEVDADLLEEVRVLFGGLDLCRRGVDGLGHEEALGFQGALEDALAEALIEDAFVEGVLVDDDDAVGRLGDEVGVMNLHDGVGGLGGRG